MWFVGVLGVDRFKRELRLWLCRWNTSLPLPRHYSFFACLVYQLFFSTGWRSRRLEYEEAGLLAKPEPLPEVLTHMLINPAQWIEHVKMVRRSLPQHIQEKNDPMTLSSLQAEYLVRVVDASMISPRADPSFIGNFYFKTTALERKDDGTFIDDAEISLKRALRPLSDWSISPGEISRLRDFALDELGTVDQILDVALPMFLPESLPADFCPDSFHILSADKQRQIVSLLAYSQRDGGGVNTNNPWRMLDKTLVFLIFSYVSNDENEADRRRQIYIALHYCAPRQQGCVDFNLMHEVSLRHFGLRNIVSALVRLCEEKESNIHEMENRAQQEEEARSYIADLKRVVPVIESLDPNLFPLTKSHHSVRFMFDRLEAVESAMSARDFIDNVLLRELV